jgi:soluble lytic murein transglycosylase-like protein
MRGATILALLIAAVVAWYATHDAAPLPEATATVVIPTDPADTIPLPTKAAAVVEAPPASPPAAPSVPWGSNTAPISTAAAFSYSKNHPATPLPALAFAAMASTEPMYADEFGATYNLADEPFDPRPGQLRLLSRSGLCSAIVSVAQANELPIPFFANLIWQESSFQSKTISSAGALGIAQFIPETAIEHGLMNPFEPIQALFASGQFLRKLHRQFGNLGLAAAAYNAGPGRVNEWMAARKTLPGETRAYVARITGYRADQWLSRQFARGPEAALMPARAPCAEVKEAVAEQAQIVRVSRLMSELVAATAPPPPPQPDQTPTAALSAKRTVASNSAKSSSDKSSSDKSSSDKSSANKPSADKKKTAAAAGPAAPKLAAAKPATGSKPQSKPEVHAASTMKDQSRPQSAQNPAKPASMAANAAKRVAAQ